LKTSISANVPLAMVLLVNPDAGVARAGPTDALPATIAALATIPHISLGRICRLLL
jgi:hypothetical protein